ncbi:hypothetical protein [Peribacillus deserti]|uniref:Uncharacterized protein n=1 Tax=Peribacillus deserti TaxID=673318 RepID=A0A2N5M3H5_9BACI|nr:hypothetical protein [Peribacillus deserti]PLT28875.1 hypothetical protein CUU66_16135 [Peribacillus deserti]
MTLGIVVIGMVCGCIILTGAASYIHKKRDSPLDLDEGIKNASNAQKIYTENTLQNAKNDYFHPG